MAQSGLSMHKNMYLKLGHSSNNLFESVKFLDVDEDLSSYMQHEWSWVQKHMLYFDHQCQVQLYPYYSS
jgi:hypothetical protein